jgi:hypothetical protein
MKTCNIKSLNWILGIVLAILSIVTSLADSFDSSWFEPILIVTSPIAGGIAILVGLQYHNFWGLGPNSRHFWALYSTISACVVFGVVICAVNDATVDPYLSNSPLMYLAFCLFPVFGMFIGMVWNLVDDIRASLMYR